VCHANIEDGERHEAAQPARKSLAQRHAGFFVENGADQIASGVPKSFELGLSI
jgi:hypothetical protein